MGCCGKEDISNQVVSADVDFDGCMQAPKGPDCSIKNVYVH